MHARLLALGFLAAPGWRPSRGVLARAGRHLRAMLRAAAERRLLAEMSDRELRDIGLTRLDARAEAARWPWDLGVAGEDRGAIRRGRHDRGH